ncbi:DUF2207 domain-containing protein [Kiloniella antarctica]|uniref:DUF2207 domain-containing protein n=1 Tax=Kiloniella antarctica TaxID=1550907 RepID=A0ABW5BFG0_9PROT
MNFLSVRLITFWSLILIVFGVSSIAIANDERITRYKSDIVVNKDGSLLVTETITVQAQGQKIKRGIYRDFPTKYIVAGNNYSVGFELISVKRDGVPDSYHTENLRNGVRIYVGRKEYFLPKGSYQYELRYKTTRQLSFLENVDELYWNVTGNGWDFPIDEIVARVHLPEGADIIQSTGSTGYDGRSGKSYQSSVGQNVLTVETTRVLKSYEGLSVVVSWPKGFVREPTSYEETEMLVRDNFGVVVGFAALVFMTSYYLITWYFYGLDPKKGIIIPQFTAPKGMSPAAVGYVLNHGFRNGFDVRTAFSAALTSLATKGFITIDQENSDYRLQRQDLGSASKLPKGEKKILEILVSQVGEEFVLESKYNTTFSSAFTNFQEEVRSEYKAGYFNLNMGKWLFGFLIGVIGAFTSLFYSAGEAMIPGIFIMVFVGVFSGVYLPGISLLLAWLLTSIGFPKLLAEKIPLLIFLLIPMLALTLIEEITGEILAIELYSIITLIFTIVLLFRHLLEAPTMKGRKVMDAIEGYKHYLCVAEKDRLEVVGKEPEFNETLYERHLPYAIALGVEGQWSKRLNGYFASMNKESAEYQPGWYNGDIYSHDSSYGSSNFVSGLTNGISHTISAASTPPSSSSSGSGFSGGGGSSGGGGGGGGGGGW